jgi:hypothetical protein
MRNNLFVGNVIGATSGAVIIALAGTASATQIAHMATVPIPNKMATDGVNVYFADYVGCDGAPNFTCHGNVWSVPVNGGTPPVAIAPGLSFPRDVGYAASKVFFGGNRGANQTMPTLGFVSPSGGAPTFLYSATGTDIGVVPEVDGSGVFFAEAQGGGQFTVYELSSTPGSMPTPLFSENGTANAIAIDAQFLYIATDTDGNLGTAAIRKASKLSASTPEILSTDVQRPTGLAVASGERLFWANAGVTAGGGSIKSFAPGDETQTLYSGGSPVDIASDGQCVYWTDQSTGQVLSVPAGGGLPTVIFQGPPGTVTMNVVLDTSNVYFSLQNAMGWFLEKAPKGCGEAKRSLQCVPLASNVHVYSPTNSVTVEADSNSLVGFFYDTGGGGNARVDTRTILGLSGSPASGLRGYEYRIDMSQATIGDGTPCIASLTMNFGTPIPGDFNGDGVPDECYYLTSGLGTVLPSNVAIFPNGDITIDFGVGACAGHLGSFPVGFLHLGPPNVPNLIPALAVDNLEPPRGYLTQVRGPIPAPAPAVPSVPASGLALLAAVLAGVGARFALRRRRLK